MRAAIAFHDRDSITKLLLPLKVNPYILLAIVKDENDNIVGSYTAQHLNEEELESYTKLLNGKQLQESHSGNQKFIEEATFSYMYVIKPIYFLFYNIFYFFCSRT